MQHVGTSWDIGIVGAIVKISLQRRLEDSQVTQGRGIVGFLPIGVELGNRNRSQNTYDGNDNQQLDEGETSHI